MQLANVVDLPLSTLEQMAGSTEAKKVLLAAASHLAGKGMIARFHNVSFDRLSRAEASVEAGITELGPLLDKMASEIAEERASFVKKAAEQHKLATLTNARGATEYAARATAQEKAFTRKAEIRDPNNSDYPALLKRRWRASVSSTRSRRLASLLWLTCRVAIV